MYQYNNSGWKFQGNYGPSAVNLRIGHDLDAEDIVRWDQAAASPSGIGLRQVFPVYPHGIPEAVRARYKLEGRLPASPSVAGPDVRPVASFAGRPVGTPRFADFTA